MRLTLSDLSARWQTAVVDLDRRRGVLLSDITAACAEVKTACGLMEQMVSGSLTDLPSEAMQLRPLRRVLAAIEGYEGALEEITRNLPEAVPYRGPDLVAAFGLPRGTSRLDRLYSFRLREVSLPLRLVAGDFLIEDTLNRASLDGSLQQLIAKTLLDLRVPWQSRRGTRSGDADQEIELWRGRAAEAVSHFPVLLEKYKAWSDGQASCLATSLARGGRYTAAGRAWNSQQRRKNLEFWYRQQRAVQALLELEGNWDRLGQSSRAITSDTLVSAEQERTAWLAVLDECLAYLQRWQPGKEPFQPPRPNLELTTTKIRAEEWQSRIDAESRALLPEFIESVAPLPLPPKLRAPWRRLGPRMHMQSAWQHVVQPAVTAAIETYSSVSLRLAREITHALDVVEYGMESDHAGAGPQGSFLAESLANATALLEAEKRAAATLPAVDSTPLEAAIAQAFREAHFAMEVGRAGLLAHLSRQRGVRAWKIVRSRGVRTLRAVAQTTLSWFRRATDWTLEAIGWKTPPRQILPPVVSRPDLPGALDINVQYRQKLPGLYRHLFALSPVEDPRFLIGREAELEGLGQALKAWNEGRFAAVLLAGARGSGKTSLLNCASRSVLTGYPVLRGQFHLRLTTRAEMDEFLERQLGDLQAPGRRIVVLEEFERTFLRTLTGFEALHRLLELIPRTASNILWIFSLNDHAMTYLNAAAGLERVFSHRINAMSMRPETLRKAILQRHGLSGLALQFAPPPANHPKVSRLREMLGISHDSEAMFFESLYEQSGGVFRSAFELWQSAIVRVEGGTVEMRQPIAPDFSALRGALDQQDHFHLSAMLQHGSLTTSELSAVLTEPDGISMRRRERLHTMGLVAPDPDHPGDRIAPEARRFVIDSLQRVNLL